MAFVTIQKIKKNIGKFWIKLHCQRLAFLFLKSYSQNDDLLIVYFLARCYHTGSACKPNYEKAFYYYNIAAEQQHSWSLVYLGQLFELGYGIERNYDKAFSCYHQAAKLGDARAFNRLGLCYKKGLGTEIDTQLEIEAYRNASNKGFIWGTYNLAACYVSGRCVNKDIAKALFLLNQKGVRNLSCAQNLLGFCYMHGKTRSDLRKGLSYYRKAVRKGNTDAIMNLGNHYFYQKNYGKAIKFFVKAAKKLNCQAVHSLAICFEKGFGVEQNPDIASRLYEEARRLGYQSERF